VRHWSNGLIPHLPPSLVGCRVLLVTGEEGAEAAVGGWPALLYDRGVAEIVVALGGMRPRGDCEWPDHRVSYFHLGWEWPVLGEFDVVLCSALYPAWYGQCGDHDRIWAWLAAHTAPAGLVRWVAATDRIAAGGAAVRAGYYKRKYILAAAQRAFHEVTNLDPGPLPYTEVWGAARPANRRPARSVGSWGGGGGSAGAALLPAASSGGNPVAVARPAGNNGGGVAVNHPRWALILGGAAGVWEEVVTWERLYGRPWDGLVVAVNDVGCHWPRALDHWVTLHPDKLAGWKALRAGYGHSDGYVTWGKAERPVDRFLHPWPGGSSGMYAIQVAKELGAVRAVLCGVPMTATPHFAESTVHGTGAPWTAVAGHWRAWERQADKLLGWVKSMSGRSQELLGAPTLAWLFEGEGGVALGS